jgi:hypothetical protein
MWFKTGKTIVFGYGILLALAAGGLAFANIFGIVAGIFQFGTERAPDAAVLQTWVHRGWIFGVGVALFGVVMKRLQKLRKQRTRTGEKPEDKPLQQETSQQETPKGRRHGLLASMAWGGFGGALLGGMLGATFILLWFSLTYSPFAPQEWVSSVSVERQRTGASGREEPVLTTDHPVAAYAFGIPLVLGGIAGAVFGGVAGVYEVE